MAATSRRARSPSSGWPTIREMQSSSTTGGTRPRPWPRCRRSTRSPRTPPGWRTSPGRGSPAWSSRAQHKPMIDLDRHAADAARPRSRAYLGDGNFGGYYERPDEDMLAIWEVAVEETRDAARRRPGRERRPILIWGAGAIGGTLGAALVRAGHDVALRRPRRRRMSRRSTPRGLRITGPDRRGHVAAPAVTAGARRGPLRAHLPLRQGAGHARPRPRRSRRISPTTAASSRPQNGLNELAIAETVGARAHDRLLRQFRRRLSRARAWSTMAAAARSWSASSTAASRRALEELHALLREFEPDAVLTAQHLGLSLEQARLRRAAVRDRAHRRLDRRRARRRRATARC